MVSFLAEVLRGVAFRDNNFKPLASNNPSPSTIGWALGGGAATSDGDIISLSSAVATSVNKNIPGSLSTNTYPYLVTRGYYTNGSNYTVTVNYTSGADTFTFTNTKMQTITSALTSGKTISNIQLATSGLLGSCFFDYVAICGQPPLQLSQKDLEFGTVTRLGSSGIDHAELRLDNLAGKFVSGASAVGFGDHLHIYLGQGATPFHVYGGYVENREPVQPADEITLYSRGFGVSLLQTIQLILAQSVTPQTEINSVLDSYVNAASKNGIAIPTGYQVTRSFVQALGPTIPVYISLLKNAWDVFKELGDFTVANATPVALFVDPAENLHMVPIGPAGSPNWGTDPFPATYPTTMAVGVNQIFNRFRKDVSSLRNRVHYIGTAQFPAVFDSWTENNSSSWGTERVATNATLTLSDTASPVAIGSKSVQCHYDDHLSNGTALNGAFFYPSAKNLALDIASLGSPQSPPLFDFFLRHHFAGNIGTGPTTPDSIFFATDATNRFEYNLVSDGSRLAENSILGVQGNNNVKQDFWQNIILPIGPNAGTLFQNTLKVNGITQMSSSGPGAYKLTDVGTPSWSNINYIGVFNSDNGVIGGHTVDIYADGWFIIGGKYRIAYDNRTIANGRYPDMREIFFWDPISKDDYAIKNIAKAELLRLRSAILRGSFMIPGTGDLIPEQQVLVTAPSANLSAAPLRASQVVHRFSQKGFITDVSVSDDFTNTQVVEPFKFINTVLQTGENAVFSREIYDLKTALIDAGFTPVLDPYT